MSEPLVFTATDIKTVTIGQPVDITWTGGAANSYVDIAVRDDSKTPPVVTTIASVNTNSASERVHHYVWTPAASLTGSAYHFTLQQGEEVRESQTFTVLKQSSAATTTTPSGPSSSAVPVISTTTSLGSSPVPSASNRVIAYGYPPSISAYQPSASFTPSEIAYKIVLPTFTLCVALAVLIWDLTRRRARRRLRREQRKLEGKPEPSRRGNALARLFRSGRKRKHGDDDESRAEEAGSQSLSEMATVAPSSPRAQQAELRELDGTELARPSPAAHPSGAWSATKAAPKPLVTLVYEKDGTQLERRAELGSGKLRDERKIYEDDERDGWMRKFSWSTSGSMAKDKELV